MKIGIIVYSQTGNTLSVLEDIKKKLEKKDHEVTIEKITIKGEPEPMKPVKFTHVPDTSTYDALIFGAPVHAFYLTMPMDQFLKENANMKGKKVVCLTTQAFPFAWMGGNRVIGQMTAICKSKGAKVLGTGIVNWMGEGRRKKIQKKVVSHIVSLF